MKPKDKKGYQNFLHNLNETITSRQILPLILILFMLLGTIIGWEIDQSTQNQKYETAQNHPTFYIDSIEGLNLRESPGLNAKKIETMNYGAKIEPLEKTGDWYKVRYLDRTGWASSEYIKAQKPKELSIRDLDFTKIIPTENGINNLLPVQYADFNQDGREEALLTVTNGYQKKEFYIYGYQDGLILRKYLDLRPQSLPEAYQIGYMGFESLEYANNRLDFNYPLYNKEDPSCCPTGGKANIDFKWQDNRFIIDAINKG